MNPMVNRAGSRKLRAEVVFQRADLPAQRRLRHVQQTRRADEAEFLGTVTK
jgi:hypothetical protein